MTDTITLTGLIATPPRQFTTGSGLPITSFRLASTQRRFDRAQNKWIDGETNWYTVSAFRQLALNTGVSLNKGDRVVVSGRLRIRNWQSGEKSGTNIEVEADALGHDLSWGTARWVRAASPSSAQTDGPPDQVPSTVNLQPFGAASEPGDYGTSFGAERSEPAGDGESPGDSADVEPGGQYDDNQAASARRAVDISTPF
ncbi:MAG: single-stranded DNA-binding protein [Microbacteriaceae bacterium]|jgi:single-strand DNA-binding protein|nr:single-stranded DNA-binding protein [Microbacteriaceae bacterium]HEV7956225.1 single-stranded DNA-binding protein [Marisediminicola sp.]